ncbi:nucleocapsid [Nyavirus gerbillisci]|uniref:Nucleocapsid n=1 Tax=Toure nyavirus TaxID=2994001 RepID=A0A9E8DBT1_9MONO|nr:nucleocapsid [Toure nyavirus]
MTSLREQLDQLYNHHIQGGAELSVVGVKRGPLYVKPLSAMAQNNSQKLTSTVEDDLIGLGISCAVRCLPDLLQHGGNSWEEIVTEVSNNNEVLVTDTQGQTKPAERTPLLLQVGAYLGMATLCYMVKPKTADNTEYMRSRWNTLLSTMGIINLLEQQDGLELKCMAIAEIDAKRLAASCLRPVIVRAIRDYEKEALPPIIKALLAQVQMVYEGYGMAMVQEMYQLAKGKPMRKVLLQSPVANEAAQFVAAYEALRDRYDEDFLYLGALGIQEESLHHKKYPNLYYAASALAQGENRLNAGMQYSTRPTSIDKEVLKKEALKTIQTGRKITDDVVEKLKALGHDISGLQAAEERSKRRKRRYLGSDEEEEEDME